MSAIPFVARNGLAVGPNLNPYIISDASGNVTALTLTSGAQNVSGNITITGGLSATSNITSASSSRLVVNGVTDDLSTGIQGTSLRTTGNSTIGGVLKVGSPSSLGTGDAAGFNSSGGLYPLYLYTGSSGYSGLLDGASGTGNGIYTNKANNNVQIQINGSSPYLFNSSAFQGVASVTGDFTINWQNTSAGTTSTAKLNLLNNTGNGITMEKYSSGYSGSWAGIPAANLAIIIDNAIAANSNGLVIGTSPSTPLYFVTNSTVRGQFSAAGNLLLNTATDNGTNTFQINGTQVIHNGTGDSWSGVNTDTLSVGVTSATSGYNYLSARNPAGSYVFKLVGTGDLIHGLNSSVSLSGTAPTGSFQMDSYGRLGFGSSPFNWGSLYHGFDVNGLAYISSGTGSYITGNLYNNGTYWYVPTTGSGMFCYVGYNGFHVASVQSFAGGSQVTPVDQLYMDINGNTTLSGNLTVANAAASTASVLTVGNASVAGNHRINVFGAGTNYYGYYLAGNPAIISYAGTPTHLLIGSDGVNTNFQNITFFANGAQVGQFSTSGLSIGAGSGGTYISATAYTYAGLTGPLIQGNAAAGQTMMIGNNALSGGMPIAFVGGGNAVYATINSSGISTNAISGTTGSFSGQITSTVATGTAPFVVSSTTPVANLSIGGNAATATTATNVSGGTVNATTGSFSGTVTCSNATASGQAVTLGQAEYVYTTATTPLPGTNTAISVAHGLSAIPTDVSLELTCLTADNGYAVGDVLEFGGFGVWTGSSGIDPIPLWKSATNVGFTVPNTLVIVASNKGGGAAASLTLANWSYRFKMKTI